MPIVSIGVTPSSQYDILGVMYSIHRTSESGDSSTLTFNPLVQYTQNICIW